MQKEPRKLTKEQRIRYTANAKAARLARKKRAEEYKRNKHTTQLLQ